MDPNLEMDTVGVGGGVSCRRASDVVTDQFPAGLRVLVVDDDPTCLKILEKMLRKCLYEVITCTRAAVALTMLRERKYIFDLVISDVHMPDMDGFKLLEHIGLEMDLPVIMMSMDEQKEVVMKGVTHGACDYLIKPIRIEAIRNIWQHVVRKRRNELKELEQSGSIDENDRNRKTAGDDYTSSVNEGSWKNSKKRKEEEDEGDDRDDTSTLKKPRVVWSVELHKQFVEAVKQLTVDKAVPKKILELMNVPGLTRENVASHLQKYRLYLRRVSGGSQNGLSTSFMCSEEASFAAMSSLDGLDLPSFAVQTPPNSFATIQRRGLARPALNTGIAMPQLNQMNSFNSEDSKFRFGVSQQMNFNNKQVDLYHGLPTTMEPEQLAHLHQSFPFSGGRGLQVSEGATSFMSLPTHGTHSMTHNDIVHGSQSGSLIMQRAQSRPRGQLLNEISSSHPSVTSLPIGQQIMSNEMAGRVGGRNLAVVNGRATTYSAGSQPTSMLDFQMNHNLELPGSGFPLGAKNQAWELQNVDRTFDTISTSQAHPTRQYQHPRPLQGNINLSSAVLTNQNLASTLPVDNSFRIKTEHMGDLNRDVFLSKQFDQDDLLSAVLKQQGVGQVDSDFNFDGYPIDNIPVSLLR